MDGIKIVMFPLLLFNYLEDRRTCGNIVSYTKSYASFTYTNHEKK
jgi:hypothetical protein